MYLTILKTRNLTKQMQTAALTQVASVRFSKNESPSYINNGEGWTESHAADWLLDRNLTVDDIENDSGYIRAKQMPMGKNPNGEEFDIGVLVMRCAKNS